MKTKGYSRDEIQRMIVLMKSKGVYHQARVGFAKHAPIFIDHFDKIWLIGRDGPELAINIDWSKTARSDIIDWAEPRRGGK